MKAKPRKDPSQYADFMARAYAMELEATERYAQFAEQLETHNNREVAQLFRKLADIEALHAKRILEEMRWPSLPAMPAAYAWEGLEAPETAPFDALHYLMQPWHALQIALRCEQEAQKYYDGIAASRAPKAVRDAAREMAAEEAEHVRLIQEWMKRVPQPTADWDEDPDPPSIE
jgi:rubrerythrin